MINFGLQCYFVDIAVAVLLIILQIMKEIRENKIQLYEFPDCEDEEENRLNKKLKVRSVGPCALMSEVPLLLE